MAAYWVYCSAVSMVSVMELWMVVMSVCKMVVLKDERKEIEMAVMMVDQRADLSVSPRDPE